MEEEEREALNRQPMTTTADAHTATAVDGQARTTTELPPPPPPMDGNEQLAAMALAAIAGGEARGPRGRPSSRGRRQKQGSLQALATKVRHWDICTLHRSCSPFVARTSHGDNFSSLTFVLQDATDGDIAEEDGGLDGVDERVLAGGASGRMKRRGAGKNSRLQDWQE